MLDETHLTLYSEAYKSTKVLRVTLLDDYDGGFKVEYSVGDSMESVYVIVLKVAGGYKGILMDHTDLTMIAVYKIILNFSTSSLTGYSISVSKSDATADVDEYVETWIQYYLYRWGYRRGVAVAAYAAVQATTDVIAHDWFISYASYSGLHTEIMVQGRDSNGNVLETYYTIVKEFGRGLSSTYTVIIATGLSTIHAHDVIILRDAQDSYWTAVYSHSSRFQLMLLNTDAKTVEGGYLASHNIYTTIEIALQERIDAYLAISIEGVEAEQESVRRESSAAVSAIMLYDFDFSIKDIDLESTTVMTTTTSVILSTPTNYYSMIVHRLHLTEAYALYQITLQRGDRPVHYFVRVQHKSGLNYHASVLTGSSVLASYSITMDQISSTDFVGVSMKTLGTINIERSLWTYLTWFYETNGEWQITRTKISEGYVPYSKTTVTYEVYKHPETGVEHNVFKNGTVIDEFGVILTLDGGSAWLKEAWKSMLVRTISRTGTRQALHRIIMNPITG